MVHVEALTTTMHVNTIAANASARECTRIMRQGRLVMKCSLHGLHFNPSLLFKSTCQQ